MTAHNTSKQLSQISRSEICWLLLMSLDQLGKEKGEVRPCMSVCLDEPLVSCSCRLETAQNQMQTLPLGLAEAQCRFHPHLVGTHLYREGSDWEGMRS